MALSTAIFRSTRFSHGHMFMIGWIYYALTPLVIGFAMGLQWFQDIDVWSWSSYFDAHSKWATALVIYVALMPVVYLVGSRVGSFRRSTKQTAFQNKLANLTLLPIYAGLLIVFSLSAQQMIFAGYLDGVDSALIGPIATIEMALLFQYLFCKAAGLETLTRLYGTLLVIASVVLLSMGGRLYVLTVLAGTYFYFWNWGAKNYGSRMRSIFWIALVPVVLVVIGSWRLGESDTGSLLGFFLFAEAIYTGISGVTLLQGGSWSLLDTPRDFFAAFANIVPSALWPDKASSFTSLVDTNLQLESPFGAMSIIASTVGNFGYIGGLAFIGAVGFILESTRRVASTPILRAFYCYLVSMLPFLFFRDPFQVQVKLVLMGFLLVGTHTLIALLRKSTKVRIA